LCRRFPALGSRGGEETYVDEGVERKNSVSQHKIESGPKAGPEAQRRLLESTFIILLLGRVFLHSPPSAVTPREMGL